MAVTHQDGRITMTAASDTYVSESFLVHGLCWYGGADGNTLVVLDQDNKAVFGKTADAGDLDAFVVFPNPLPVTEITAGTMGGGTLIVYVSE